LKFNQKINWLIFFQIKLTEKKSLIFLSLLQKISVKNRQQKNRFHEETALRLPVKIKIVNNLNNHCSNYFFVVSALILLVVSALILLVVSVAAGVVAAEESAGAVTVVESEVLSVFVELPLQAVKKAATVKTTNNFFIFV